MARHLMLFTVGLRLYHICCSIVHPTRCWASRSWNIILDTIYISHRLQFVPGEVVREVREMKMEMEKYFTNFMTKYLLIHSSVHHSEVALNKYTNLFQFFHLLFWWVQVFDSSNATLNNQNELQKVKMNILIIEF